MANVKSQLPKYRHYKPKHLAVVRINGKDIYLGPYDSPESWEKYFRVVAESKATGPAIPLPPQATAPEQPRTIFQLIEAYRLFAEAYYRKDGKPTKELAGMKAAVRPLRELYGHVAVADFGPKALKTLRQHLIDHGKLCRNEVNRRINRVRRIFKWAVSEELISPAIYHALQAVAGLRYGRTDARESVPVRPVADLYVAVILPFLPPGVAAMLKIQRWTGMRPSEVVDLREGSRLRVIGYER